MSEPDNGFPIVSAYYLLSKLVYEMQLLWNIGADLLQLQFLIGFVPDF